MAGSLISSGTNTSTTTIGSGNDPFSTIGIRHQQNTSAPVAAAPSQSWDPFVTTTETRRNQTAPTVDEQITIAKNDSDLKKILSNSSLMNLYERKLAGEDVDKEIDKERKKFNLRNDDMNKYIGYKKMVLQSLANTGSSPAEAITALQKIKDLPEAMKTTMIANIKTELNNSSAVKNSVYDADKILSGDFQSILMNNPDIAKAVSKSIKNLSMNESFTLPLEQKKEINDGIKTAAKTASWGAVGAGAGALLGATALSNFWNPIGWTAAGALGVGAVAYLANSEGTRNSLGTFWQAATDYS